MSSNTDMAERPSGGSDEPTDNTDDQPSENTDEQPAEKTDDQPEEKTDDQPTDDQPSEKSDDEPADKTDDQPSESTDDQPDSGQGSDSDTGQSDEQAKQTDQADQSPAQTDDDKSGDQSDQPADGSAAAGGTGDQSSTDGFSASRTKVTKEILPEVIPAKYKHGSAEDQARFQRLLPGVDIEAQRKAMPGYTTCGALPQYVLKRVGGITDKGVLCGGLGGVRDGIPDKEGKTHGGAKTLGAWVAHDGKNRPKPGDIYLLDGPIHYKDKNTGADKTFIGIRHIGVIVSTSKNSDGTESWVTADAGQGMGVNQEADTQNRTYDPKDKTVTGKAEKGTVNGWVDLDLLVSKSAGN